MFRLPWSPDYSQQEVDEAVAAGAAALKSLIPDLEVQVDKVVVLSDRKMPAGAFAAYSWDPVAGTGTMLLRQDSAKLLCDQRAGRVPSDPDDLEMFRIQVRQSAYALLHELDHGARLAGGAAQWAIDMSAAEDGGASVAALEARITAEAAADLGGLRFFDRWAPRAGFDQPGAPIVTPALPEPIYVGTEREPSRMMITGYNMMRTYLAAVVDEIAGGDIARRETVLRDVVAGPHGHALSRKVSRELLQSAGLANPGPAALGVVSNAFLHGLAVAANEDFNGGTGEAVKGTFFALARHDPATIASAIRNVHVRSQVDQVLTDALHRDCERRVQPLVEDLRRHVAYAAGLA